jgi:hypothetical protein
MNIAATPSSPASPRAIQPAVRNAVPPSSLHTGAGLFQGMPITHKRSEDGCDGDPEVETLHPSQPPHLGCVHHQGC